jgi:hypothetical protein
MLVEPDAGGKPCPAPRSRSSNENGLCSRNLAGLLGTRASFQRIIVADISKRVYLLVAFQVLGEDPSEAFREI